MELPESGMLSWAQSIVRFGSLRVLNHCHHEMREVMEDDFFISANIW